MTCSRCGTTDNHHTKDCYEAMILGWALGFERTPPPAQAALDEADALRAQVASLTQRLADASGKLTLKDFQAAAAAPEPEPVAVIAEPEPAPAEILKQNVRDLLGEQAAADMEPAPEELSKAEYATEASEREASTGPVRKRTPTQAVDIWLNEEAVATNDEKARIVVATAPVAYTAWAADKPDMPDEISGLTVAKALKARGYKRRAPTINGRQYPAYFGVRLRHPEPEPDGSIREVRPPEEVAVVERFVTARTRPTEDPTAIVPTADMYASFQRWCVRTGQADMGRDNFSTAMQQLGAYEKGQRYGGPEGGGARGFGYLGAELTPEPLAGEKPNEVPDNQTIRKAIEAARAAARKAHEEREAAEPPPVTYTVKESEPEAKPDNNGWGKTFDTTNTVVPELTVEDVMAEHAAIEPRGGYSGPRPGAGDALDGETRDLINAVLNLDEGWTFQPAGNGTGTSGNTKTYLVAPDGSKFRQASSMGGSEGRTGNNRELRRYLSRKGMLPTAAAPASQLTSASAKPRPKAKPAPKTSSVSVISSSGVRRSPEEWIAVEAEPEAKPLTEEEMDKALFDLYVDVRAGYDGPFSYHPDVESLQGLNKDEISTAVRQPERVEVRPESKSKGYPVIKFARGDVNVIMGYRSRTNPAVIRAEWGWLLGPSPYEVDRHGGGGSKTQTGLPNTFGQLAGRLKTLGAEIAVAPDGKTAVVSYKGQELGLVTREKCPRSTTHSDWNRMTRKIHAIDRRELAAV